MYMNSVGVLHGSKLQKLISALDRLAQLPFMLCYTSWIVAWHLQFPTNEQSQLLLSLSHGYHSTEIGIFTLRMKQLYNLT